MSLRYKVADHLNGTGDDMGVARHIRTEILPLFVRYATLSGEKAIIDLDGTFGYITPFLRKAFSSATGFTAEEYIGAIRFISEDQPGLVDDIHGYIRNYKEDTV